MQTNKINTNANFGAGFSSTFEKEIEKLREKIYTTLGKDSNEMNNFKESISQIAEKFNDGKIVISKKGHKGTFLEVRNRRIAQLSPKYKRYTTDDLHEMAVKLDTIR